MLTVGDLFSGIGGFSLGLERAGMQTRWFAEVDPYASAVLRKHWPGVPNHGDVRSIRSGTAERTDVLCGGFPCQDISNAGKRAGIAGERSGLWVEFARVIGELRPRYVIVENVAALLGRGIERVLGDLAALGFDAEWHCIPAAYVGAPHRRDRVWIIAHARGEQYESGGDAIGWTRAAQLPANVAHAGCDGGERWGGPGQLATSPRKGEGEEKERQRVWDAACDCGADVADADSKRGRLWTTGREDAGNAWESSRRSVAGIWEFEPDVGRVAHGVPARVDRLRCLGNAVVPQIPEIIGRAIVARERMRTAS